MNLSKKTLANLAYLPVSLLFLFLLFNNYQQYLDISMVDETGYMELLRFKPFFYPGGYGPLYIFSYKLLYQFIPDYINLHYFAIIVLTWLPSVVFFYFLRSRKVAYFIAVYASWTMLCASYIAAFDWWARTAHYSIFFIFLFLTLAYQYKKQWVKLLLFAIVLARILAYVRPELAVTSYILILFLAIYLIYIKFYLKQKINSRFNLVEKLLLIGLLLFYFGMYAIWRSPTDNTGRMYFALGQHYKFNTMLWKHEDRKEFLHWEETFKAQFGESKTLGDMYKNNPSETIKHISFNIKHYCQQSFEFLSELFFPKVIFTINYFLKWLILLALFFLFIFRIGFKLYWQNLKEKVKDEFVFIFIAFAFAVPSVLASFAIYPREHYFIMQLVFFCYLIYILLSPLFEQFSIKSSLQYGASIFIIVVLLLISPNVKDYTRYNNFYSYEKPNYLPYIQTIRKMDINKDTTVNFLTFEILPVYLGKNFVGRPFFVKQPFYDSIIVAQNINMIYLSNVIIEDKRHKADSSFSYFMNNYQNLGWQKLQLKDKHGYIVYKKDLIQNGK